MNLIDCEKTNKEEKKKKMQHLVKKLTSPSKFKQLAEKKVEKEDWCARCNKDYKWFGSSDDYWNCRDNSDCSHCGLKREKYIDEDGEECIRWPEPFSNVIDFRDAEYYIREDSYYAEDWDYV